MKKLFGLTTLLAAFFLVACEADPALTGGATGGGGGTGGGTGGGGGASGGSGTIFMGSGSGANFQQGVIAISQTNLPAGGSASLSVTFVDSNNNLVGDEITVSFSSACAAGGLATIDPTPITTTTGGATATYSATGCSGDDTITATANIDGTVLQATGQVTVAAATVGSIGFVSADPTNIGLKGTGGVGRQETSTVRFKVTDSTGGPVPGANVDFSLNTTIGGITLTPTSATSGSDGFVQTVVSAGSVATSVRVRATVTSTSISAQSDQLTITTGIPDNDSVSVSAEFLNLEGWNTDGLATDITVRMSDRYNNPVPDGTAVTLTAEGGQIGGSCQTTTTPADGAGVCTVTFVTQAPRPADGRVTILATAIGEETFIDADSDGIFNNMDTPIEIGEPFRDDNENGIAEPGAGEVFSDFNSNQTWDDATHPDYVNFNGLLCDSMTALCSPNQTLFVSDSIVVVMSSGAALITDNVGGAVNVAGGAVASIDITVGDNKGNGTTSQPMACGTTISASTSNGTIAGPDSYTVPCSNNNGPLVFTFSVVGDTTSDSGLLTIEVESPSGIVTTHFITVDD